MCVCVSSLLFHAAYVCVCVSSLLFHPFCSECFILTRMSHYPRSRLVNWIVCYSEYGHLSLLKDCKCLFLYDTHELTFPQQWESGWGHRAKIPPPLITTAISTISSRPPHLNILLPALHQGFTELQCRHRGGSKTSPKTIFEGNLMSLGVCNCKYCILQLPAVQLWWSGKLKDQFHDISQYKSLSE